MSGPAEANRRGLSWERLELCLEEQEQLRDKGGNAWRLGQKELDTYSEAGNNGKVYSETFK